MRRIVPNIYYNDLEKSKHFYREFLDMELAMDLDRVLTLVSKVNSMEQISVLQNKNTGPLDNSAIFLSIEVADVNHCYKKAQEQEINISYSIRDEDWGVR